MEVIFHHLLNVSQIDLDDECAIGQHCAGAIDEKAEDFGTSVEREIFEEAIYVSSNSKEEETSDDGASSVSDNPFTGTEEILSDEEFSDDEEPLSLSIEDISSAEDFSESE